MTPGLIIEARQEWRGRSIRDMPGDLFCLGKKSMMQTMWSVEGQDMEQAENVNLPNREVQNNHTTPGSG